MSNCVWLSSAEGTAAPQRGPRRPPPPRSPHSRPGLLPRAGRSGLGSPVRAEGLGGTLGQWAAGGLPGPRTRGRRPTPQASKALAELSAAEERRVGVTGTRGDVAASPCRARSHRARSTPQPPPRQRPHDRLVVKCPFRAPQRGREQELSAPGDAEDRPRRLSLRDPPESLREQARFQ